MTSRAFSCKGTLLRKNLSLYILLSLGIFLLLLYPAYFMLRLLSTVPHVSLLEKFYDLINDHATGLPEVLSSLVAALCVFSYLHNKKRSTFFHSLPCSRNNLFLSSYASGLLLYFLPWLLITAFCAIYIPSVHRDGCRFFTDFLQYSAYRLLLYVVFYSVSVFAMVLCGRGFFGVLSAVALPLILPITEFFILSAVSPSLYGYGIFLDVIEPVTFNLSPFKLLMTSPAYHSGLAIPWEEAGLFAAGGILLSCLALKLHGIRKEEGVGQTIVFPVVLSVLQYLLTFLASWFLMFLFVILFTKTLMVIEVFSVYSLLVFGIPAFFLIRMLLLRTPKVFQKKALFACGIYLLCLGAVLFSFRVDLFGIVRKIPEADQVQQVQVSLSSGLAFDSHDPKDIEALIDLQKMLLASQEGLKENLDSGSYDSYVISLTYTIEGEKTMKRQYSLPSSYVNPTAARVQEEILAYFRHEDRYTKQLRKLQEEAKTLSFKRNHTNWYFLSPSQQQDFFQALEEEILNGSDPLFLFEGWGLDSRKQIRLHTADGDTITLTLPPDTTNALAFLEHIEQETNPPS